MADAIGARIYDLPLTPERVWRDLLFVCDEYQAFATTGENVPKLWERLGEHRAFLEAGGKLDERRRRNLAGEVFAVASSRAKSHLEAAVRDDPELRRLLDAVQQRELDPLSAVREIMERVFEIGDDGRTDAR